MNRILLVCLAVIIVSCKAETLSHQRLFTPGDKGEMSFKIPSGGQSLVIQPILLPGQGGASEAQAYPYTFEYTTRGADQKPLRSQRVQGLVHCDRPLDAAAKQARRCPGSRVMIDLKEAASGSAPQYLTITRENRPLSRDLYFAVTFRAPQTAYRARLHGLRLAPQEKSALLDTAYAEQQADVTQLAALSTLAPLGEKEQDYRDRVINSSAGAAPISTPRFPSYALLGPSARIIVPVYRRDAPIRVRSMPLGEATEYQLCWQPMAEPVEGRCYKVASSRAPEAIFQFPRGRLIFSARQPLALDVAYSLTDEQMFHLSDAVQQYPVHRLPQGQTLAVDLEPFKSNEYLPLRLNVWAVHSGVEPKPSAHIDLKIIGADGSVRQRERLPLSELVSTFDRSASDAEQLSPVTTFYLRANTEGGRLVISAGPEILVNLMLGRSSTPLYSRLNAGGALRTDEEREFWIPVAPLESRYQDWVASYAWNPDSTIVDTQRVFFPSLEAKPGSLALTPSHVQELTWEGRRKTSDTHRLRSGLLSEAILERGPILPLVVWGPPAAQASLRANGQTVWEGRLERNILVGNLDLSRFPSASRLQFLAQGGEFFVSGIRLAQSQSAVYGKRFYYAQPQGSFLIQKNQPQQLMNIEVLLTEAPADNARVQVTLEARSRTAQPLVTREFTHTSRDYAIEPRPLALDSFLMDGRKAELLSLPLPLRADLPAGEYLVHVRTTGLNGMLLAVSSQLPHVGIRVAAASHQTQPHEAAE